MALVAGNAQLKARLQDKGRLRPYKMVRKKLPDGSGLLDKLPERMPGAGPDDHAADDAYCKAIQRVSNVFGKQRRGQSTADEHKMYVRLFDTTAGSCCLLKASVEGSGPQWRGLESSSDW